MPDPLPRGGVARPLVYRYLKPLFFALFESSVDCLRLLGRILHHKIALGAFHSILIRIVVNDGMLTSEIVPRWGRGNAPFERGCVPWILRGLLAAESAVNQIKQKYELCSSGNECGY